MNLTDGILASPEGEGFVGPGVGGVGDLIADCGFRNADSVFGRGIRNPQLNRAAHPHAAPFVPFETDATKSGRTREGIFSVTY